MKISIVCAMDEKRGIGKDNKLMWNIPADLKRFREITSGHPIIMGRKTFESIGRVLPNRTNIIVTRDPNYRVEGAVIVHSLEEALEFSRSVILSKAKDLGPKNRDSSPSVQNDIPGEVFVIGGGQIFEQALPLASKLYLTVVRARLDSPPESPARRGDFGADAFFPEYQQFTKKTFEENHKDDKYEYTFVNLERDAESSSA